MDFGNHDESDDDEGKYDEWKAHPAIVNAKKKWMRLFEVIMDHRSQVPLKQMALKSKHEQVIFDQM